MFTELLSLGEHSSEIYGPETNKTDLGLHGGYILVGKMEKIKAFVLLRKIQQGEGVLGWRSMVFNRVDMEGLTDCPIVWGLLLFCNISTSASPSPSAWMMEVKSIIQSPVFISLYLQNKTPIPLKYPNHKGLGPTCQISRKVRLFLGFLPQILLRVTGVGWSCPLISP